MHNHVFELQKDIFPQDKIQSNIFLSIRKLKSVLNGDEENNQNAEVSGSPQRFCSG